MLTASVNLPDDDIQLLCNKDGPVSLSLLLEDPFFGQLVGMKWYLIVNLCKFFGLYQSLGHFSVGV